MYKLVKDTIIIIDGRQVKQIFLPINVKSSPSIEILKPCFRARLI